ncbi:MAG: rRNA maturation RNase YbeY [Burkholderiales bacterium]|nr:rRNA maturation RNase YbeY [Burkholderiales bacterium]
MPSPGAVARWARAALPRRAEVAVRFVGAREARALNRTFRGRDYATNVLTFVYENRPRRPLAGDLVLCVPVVAREAREQGKPARAHYAHLLVHGALHLAGHDHERAADARRMQARERRILARLGFADPYADPYADPGAAPRPARRAR